ncbi:MAG: WD40 repeat domain-containing protein, partial [Deltaproteobacteria bacterium]|nr:WD40 repeat domain-containing protein [Deltaproteobacteria bacterium]
AVLAAGTLEEQRLIRDAFRRLVTADGTRAVLARGELETVLGGERAAGVVERLIGARLLVAAEAEEGDAVEIIHEALIGAWPRLVQWRRDDAEGARLRDQLRTAAQQWHARDRARGLLWRDDALDDYRRWRARWPDPLPALDEEFASASLADAARGRRRRRALMASAATILVGATVALSLLYRASEENATVAQDRLVASYVESGRRWLIDGDYLRALPYLSAAYSAGDDTPALRFMLHRAMKLADTPVYRGAPEARAAGFRADGSVVAVHTDGSAEILDGATARVIAALPAAPAGEVDPDATGDVSADGALAAVPRKAAVVLWDGLASRSLPVSATRVAFDATGARLATASATELAVWDVATATRVWVLPLDGVVMDLAWSGDAVLARFRGGRALLARPVITPLENAKRIASAADGSIALLGGEGVALHAADGGVRSIQIPDAASVAFDETRGKLAVGTNNGVVQLYDRATGQFLGSCVGHVGPVRMVSFAPDGQILATIGSDRTLRVWDATWRRELARFVGLDGAPNSLRFDGGGHRMVVATTDGHVHTFPVVDPAAQLVVDAGEVLGATRFANGGARIFANTESGVALWDATTGQRVARLAIATGDGASLSPDGDLVALPLAGEPTLELRGSIDGPVRARLSLAAVGTATAFDHRGQRVVSAATNGAVDVWSVDGSHLASLRGHVGEVWTAAFSPDDRRVVTAGYSDRTARVWDAATGAQLAAVSVGDSMVSAAFDATGERVLTASEDRVARLWDARRAVQLQAFVHDTTISGAALRGDGALLVGGTGDGVVAVWDVPSGQIIGTFRHGRYVGSVDFAPDGRRLLSASGDHRAISWDVADDIPGRSETAAFVACHSPYRLRVTQLEIVTPDACK